VIVGQWDRETGRRGDSGTVGWTDRLRTDMDWAEGNGTYRTYGTYMWDWINPMDPTNRGHVTWAEGNGTYRTYRTYMWDRTNLMDSTNRGSAN
jgi:hypothetical protein